MLWTQANIQHSELLDEGSVAGHEAFSRENFRAFGRDVLSVRG